MVPLSANFEERLDMEQYDVLVIGAGAAGMIAALEIALTGKKVVVLEAKERCGGRMHTVTNSNNYPIELGAEFVHGNLPITLELTKKASAKLHEVKGSIWQKKDGKLEEQEDFIEDFSTLEKKFRGLTNDISVKDFFDTHLKGNEFEELRFTLQNYVEGYYAADINKASTFALREELTKGDEEQYRIDGGYQVLIDYLENQCQQNGVQFIFSQPVHQLHWKKGNVEAVTEKASYRAGKALVTVSIGVLKANGITFSPALPEKQEAAKQLGFGHVMKMNLWFSDAFWKDKMYTEGKNLRDLNFLFSEEPVPTWWTQHPKDEAVLTGWLGGPKAATTSYLNDEELLEKSLTSLSHIFNLTIDDVKIKLQKHYSHNWSQDLHFHGAYSYAVLEGERYMEQILEPVENTVYFAGEGLHSGNEIGTVEAALQSGRSVAHQLIASL